MTSARRWSDFRMMLIHPRLSIRSKLLVASICTIILFGVIHILVVYKIVRSQVREQFREQGIRLAVHMSRELEDVILYEDWVEVQQQLWKWKSATSAHGYAVVLSPDGRVLSSTFTNGLPVGLLEANPVPFHQPEATLLYDKDVPYLDVGVSIMSGVAGFLRLGIQRPTTELTSDAVARTLVLMVIGFVAIGSIGNTLFSRMITKPLNQIVSMTRKIDLNEPAPSLEIRTGDELEVLAETYETMLHRLQDHHRRLIEANRRAHQAEKLASIGMISSGVAHEINNPLMGIETGLKRIARNPSSVEQIERYLPAMLNGIEHIKGVVDGLLRMARKDGGTKASVDVGHIIKDSIRMVQHRLDDRRIRTSIKSPCGSVPLAKVDPQDLLQAIINILLNAADAISEGGTVWISYEIADSDVRIDITDKGSGIEEKNLDKIWEPFYTTKRPGRGTGLGLAITKKLVEANEGTLSATSRTGVGTTIRITIPVDGDLHR